ncbi:MAG TPA: sugar phosphate isomerase/epimerase family protein [Flavitalea sp.]|nr:sugar phosphate isomerase/epimerase family protein [Flavitalea sp.]
MNNSRRSFIRSSVLGLTGVALGGNRLMALSPARREVVGLQLYSVRRDMNANPLDTLTHLARIGYKYVEHANYVDRKFYGYPAAEFKKVLSDLGMKMPTGHTVFRREHWDASKKDFSDSWKATVEDAAIVGQEFVISPSLEQSIRKDYDEMLRYMDIFNRCGELCKRSGMRFGYHNHDFEFSELLNNVPLYDHILKNTDPSLVIQQLDIGNMYNGGAKALDIMNKYPGRFQSMHVKDEIEVKGRGERYESTILGSGIVPVKEVLDLGRKSGGTVHFIIEQESYQGKAPIDCMKENYLIMRKWGYK